MNYQLTICEPGNNRKILVKEVPIKADCTPQIGEHREFIINFLDKLKREHTLKIVFKIKTVTKGVWLSTFKPPYGFQESTWCIVTAEPVAKQYKKSMTRFKKFMKKPL